MLEMELKPFGRDERTMKQLKEKIEERVVRNALEADPGVREAVAKVIQRSNGDVGDSAYVGTMMVSLGRFV